MVGTLKNIAFYFFLILVLGILLAGCSERVSEQVVLPDSTIVYPAKDSNDISAKITFSRNYGQKSGRQWAITDVFPLNENENVNAVISLGNRPNFMERDLMFHIDWIGPDGRSVYLKRIDLSPGDSSTALVSSISTEPGNRLAGQYGLRVYLFRELIAEKQFELRPENELDKARADIVLFKSMDRETGEMKGVDTVFEIKKKGILRAKVNMLQTDIFADEVLPVRIDWAGPDGKSFYDKRADFLQSDPSASIFSSISITPDKREPGEYYLRVYLFDEMIGEKRFLLKLSD
ncbi:MAG: hypothetical protein MUC31_02060 [Bacteroidales bacterium]|jgi:hypothetical protein|nr:hypothetical protein [Bacteroidales bacterium]